MKRFNTINVEGNLSVVDYELPKTPSSEYVVDDSNFVPISEAVKQLGANNTGADDLIACYDFPDGNDNGMSVPISRTKNGKDIAEISSHIMAQIDETTEHIQKEKGYQNRKKAFEKSISEAKASSLSSGTSVKSE